MAIFFFVVGLEIKRELVEGELRDPRRAALPGDRRRRRDGRAGADLRWRSTPAAPAPTAGASRWPRTSPWPSACSACSVPRVDPSLKLFLLALAIVDDIGAIVVIAVFYSDGIDLALAARRRRCSLAVVVGADAAGVRAVAVYVVLGVALWLALHESGIHATIAGVVLGLLAPTRPVRRRELIDADELPTSRRSSRPARPWRWPASRCRSSSGSSTCCTRGRASSIVPLFALANAGMPVTADALSAACVVADHPRRRRRARRRQAGRRHRVHVAGRPAAASASCRRARRGVSIVGIGAVAGIGFTVSLFVTGLAFDDAALQDEAKIGILAASIARRGSSAR